MRRACFVIALALIPLAVAPLARAQAIVTHGADEPARLDGPWLLYEGDPSGGQIASADPRPGRTYRLGAERTPTQGPNIIWLRATVSSDEPLSNPSELPDSRAIRTCKRGQCTSQNRANLLSKAQVLGNRPSRKTPWY